MQIFTDFIGGNAEILEVTPSRVLFRPQLRDTKGQWFYWAFCVKGAQGLTVTFDMAPLAFVGRFGAAVSHDLESWHWSGHTETGREFVYTFGPDEDCVYFAHDMLYQPPRFHAFCERLGLREDVLCLSEKATPIPAVRFGEGTRQILLTARHHCCESTGSYVLEGVLEALHADLLSGFRVCAVPFVDIDGVLAGDQGKNRIPHDHNRDYTDAPLYAGVQALQVIAADPATCVAFDFHAPNHLGGRNDHAFLVYKAGHTLGAQLRFGKLFQSELTVDAFRYNPMRDMPAEVEWNSGRVMSGSFSGFCSVQPHIELCCTLETAYFGLTDNPVTQERLVSMGRAFGRALLRWLRERSA